jgi:hypothetical protein
VVSMTLTAMVQNSGRPISTERSRWPKAACVSCSRTEMIENESALFELLHRLESKVDALPREFVERMNDHELFTPANLADRQSIGPLLRALNERIGGDTVFTARDVVSLMNGSPTLRAAVEHAIGFVDAHAARRLGKFIRRIANCGEHGLQIVCAGAARDGTLWVLQSKRK